jgi:hypothetical protein
MTSLSFDDLVGYVRGLKGRQVRIQARAAGASEAAVFLTGDFVQMYDGSAPGSDFRRYWCEVGTSGSGFILSGRNFGAAWIDIYDPELFAVNISLDAQDVGASQSGKFRIVIPDERIPSRNGPLPV